MPVKPPSTQSRAFLRQRIRDRVADLKLGHSDAAEELGLTPAQWSRLKDDEDIFSLDRLIDAAARVGLTVRVTATRPYERR